MGVRAPVREMHGRRRRAHLRGLFRRTRGEDGGGVETSMVSGIEPLGMRGELGIRLGDWAEPGRVDRKTGEKGADAVVCWNASGRAYASGIGT